MCVNISSACCYLMLPLPYLHLNQTCPDACTLHLLSVTVVKPFIYSEVLVPKISGKAHV